MGRTQPSFPKIAKSLCAGAKILPSVSLLYFTPAGGWGVFLGEAVRIPHLGVFLPRLIYLKGNLSGHKIPPRKIPTKFIPVPTPLIHSLGQQWIVGLRTRVLFLLIITTSSELKRASVKSEISIFLEMSFHLNLQFYGLKKLN